MRERVEVEREWFSQIFDSIPDEIVVVDTDMIILDANSIFLKNNHHDIESIRGQHCYDVEQAIRGDCQVAVENCPFHRVIQSGEMVSLVRKHFDKNGHTRYAAIVAAPLRDRDGTIQGMIESTRDITDRIRAEEKLKETEIQLQQFMEMAPIAAYIKNQQGNYIEVNPAMCRLFNRTKQEILGHTPFEIVNREAAESFRESDRKVLKTGQPIAFEEEVILNNRRVFLSTTKYPVMDADGHIRAVCGLSRDVTDLKAAEQELKRTRDYLQNIVNNSPVIIITSDMDDRLVSFNPGAEESLGYSFEEVVHRPASDMYQNPLERERLVRRVRTEGSVRDCEVQLLRKDGSTLPVSLTLSQLKDSEGNIVGTVGMGKDISRRKLLLGQVMQSERLAALGRLASGVAHEINNPLAVISEITGYLLELLEADPQATDAETIKELHEGLPKIIKHVKRTRGITHRLLSFARKQDANEEVADVNLILDEMLPFWEKKFHLGGIKLHLSFDRSLPKVKIELLQLEELFINIINNAIQAIEETNKGGGNLWIETTMLDGKVAVKIRDDGPGIPENLRDKLFDPFVTTKAPGVGTGLGLSICYGIVKRYDGEILVDSQLGKGTEFTVVLQVYKENPKTNDESAAS